MGKFCDQCGKELLEGSAFCSYCGSPMEQQNRKGRKKWILPVGIAMVVVAAVGIGGFVVLIGGRMVEKNMELAEKHARAGDYEQALACYKKALRIDRTIAEAYLESADVCLKTGNYEEAVNWLAQGQEMMDDDEAEKLAEREEYIREHVFLQGYRGYDVEGELCEEGEYEYDENGNRTKEVRREGSDREIVFMEEMEYDENGNMIQYTSFDGAFGRYEYYKYEYDEKRTQTKQIRYDKEWNVDGWNEYEYDENGNKTKDTSYDAEGKKESYTEYEYDDAGNMIREIFYMGRGFVEVYSEEYVYDDAGNEIKRIMYDDEGGVIFWAESEYDEAGNCIKSTTNVCLGDVTAEATYTEDYEYECVLGNYYIRKRSYLKYAEEEEGTCVYENEYIYIGE